MLGLAFPAISNLNHNPFFNTAIQQRAVSQSVFGFKLAQTGSELFLGGTNNKLFYGSIEFHSVNPNSGFWQATGARVKANRRTIASGFETVIDSGTT